MPTTWRVSTDGATFELHLKWPVGFLKRVSRTGLREGTDDATRGRRACLELLVRPPFGERGLDAGITLSTLQITSHWLLRAPWCRGWYSYLHVTVEERGGLKWLPPSNTLLQSQDSNEGCPNARSLYHIAPPSLTNENKTRILKFDLRTVFSSITNVCNDYINMRAWVRDEMKGFGQKKPRILIMVTTFSGGNYKRFFFSS